MSLTDEIDDALKALLPHRLALVARIVRGLRETSPGERLANLEFAGRSISPEEADAMKQGLAGCRENWGQ
jgi:hypothetical protein